MAASKSRYFAFIVLQENASDKWIEALKETFGSFLISPLHDPDKEQKKPHWHVIYRHSNTITLEAAKAFIPEGLALNGYLLPLAHPRNYQRYLLHLDDPEKQQFEDGIAALTVINGFPVDLTRDFSSAELKEFNRKIHAMIRQFNIIEYADLMDYLADTNIDLYDYASSHTVYFNTYISSRRNKAITETEE